MQVLADLLQRVPVARESRMSAAGFAVWVCWQENLDPAVPQTLQDYGGMSMASDRDQSLWFFFSADALLALARLAVWGKFNTIAASITAFPAKLVLGSRRELGLEVETLLSGQSILSGRNLEIWLHPKLREHGESLPGLVFQEKPAQQGMAKVSWAGVTADPRLPYTSSQGWYAILRPLGNPLDKLFQAGWRSMFGNLEDALKRQKLKYLLHENFVIIQVENLRQLRGLLREFFGIFEKAKNDQTGYWPCVSAVVDRRGLNFNNELPNKVGLKWENLTPDYPYMSYRNAYLLGEGFAIYDIRSAGEQVNMDSWCNINLEDSAAEQHAVPIVMPGRLMPGRGAGCFYCGMGDHPAGQCPTLRLPADEVGSRQDLAHLSFDDINEAFAGLDIALTELGTIGYTSVQSTDPKAGALVRALFGINAASQARMAPRIWLTKAKDYPRCLEDEPQPKDASPVWDLFEQFTLAGVDKLAKLEKEIQSAVQRFPRDGRLRTLLGFCRISKGDTNSALSCFKDGAALTHSSLVQAWNEYLHARALEMLGRHADAFEQYGNVQRIIPSWTDVSYRQLVCKVKLGFGEHTLEQIRGLIAAEPHYFNRCLIDPELERGHLLILSTLYPLWVEAAGSTDPEKIKLKEIGEQVEAWFPSDHPTALHFAEPLARLRRLADIKNYVACLQLREGRPQLEKELAETLQKAVETLQERYKRYLVILQAVRDEASWFPFPNLLVVFNREFNECAGIINWAFTSNFKEAEVYKKALTHTDEVEDRLHDLKKRLKFLRMVRDTTLFVLTMGKTFFWVELISLLLCFLLVPGIIYFGEKIGLKWLQEMLAGQLWEIQQVLVIIITVMSAGIAALRSTLIFEKRRDKLIEEAKAQRERAQQVRLESIRQRRRTELETRKKEHEQDLKL